MGDFVIRSVPLRPLSRHEMLCAIPPSFSEENFLSGNDNGRFKLIQARCGLKSEGKEMGNLGKFPNELWARINACSRFENRADSGRVWRSEPES
jgi:hypothetical protein